MTSQGRGFPRFLMSNPVCTAQSEVESCQLSQATRVVQFSVLPDLKNGDSNHHPVLQFLHPKCSQTSTLLFFIIAPSLVTDPRHLSRGLICLSTTNPPVLSWHRAVRHELCKRWTWQGCLRAFSLPRGRRGLSLGSQALHGRPPVYPARPISHSSPVLPLHPSPI